MTDALTTMGTGYTFGTAQAPTSTCGGAFGATGGTTVSFTGGTIPAGGTCVLTYPGPDRAARRKPGRGPTRSRRQHHGHLGGVTVPTRRRSRRRSPSARPWVSRRPTAPATVLAGTDTRLTITISHANGAVAFTNIALADVQPASHLISTNPESGHDLRRRDGDGRPGQQRRVDLGGSLGTGATSCTIAVNVTTPPAPVRRRTDQREHCDDDPGRDQPVERHGDDHRVTGIASRSPSRSTRRSWR